MKKSNFLEKKQHGTSQFPFEYYFIDSSSPRFVMPPHWHKEFEFIRIISGRFELHLNNAEYSLGAGDIMTVDCGCIHRGTPSDDCVYECIVFNLNMLARQQSDVTYKYLQPIISSELSASSLLTGASSGAYAYAVSLFGIASQKGEAYELDVYSLLFKIFSLLYKEGRIVNQRGSRIPRQSKAISVVLDTIEQEFFNEITLTQLSELAGLNEKYLCRIFKEYTEKTIIEYLNEVRVENACYEISKKGESVTHAAFNSGFNDLSYFSKTFKRIKGVSPTEYKNTKKSNK